MSSKNFSHLIESAVLRSNKKSHFLHDAAGVKFVKFYTEY
jgi:hypothetical protein